MKNINFCCFLTNSHKKTFFTWLFPRKRRILCAVNALFILKMIQNVLLVLVLWKYRGSFFSIFFLKNGRLWKTTTIENYLSCRRFRVFQFTLSIKIYIQRLLRALITNLLSNLQIQNSGSNVVDECLKKIDI